MTFWIAEAASLLFAFATATLWLSAARIVSALGAAALGRIVAAIAFHDI